jgi:RNA polymerase sigma factor (sigma-70 family)
MSKVVGGAEVARRAAIDDTPCMSDNVEILARQYYAELIRMLSARLRSKQDAADLAQEAYLRLLRYEGQCAADELRRTLFRIANNLLTDHWRWRRLRGADSAVPIEELEVQSEQADHERQLAGEQLLRHMEEVILAMPYKRRAVFLLSRIDGLSNAEIARRCCISIKTVEKHIATALAECRAELGDDDLQSFSEAP